MKVYGEVTLQKVPNENIIAHFYGNIQYLLERPLLTLGLGIPGHAGTGAVGQAVRNRRNDLGTIPGNKH